MQEILAVDKNLYEMDYREVEKLDKKIIQIEAKMNAAKGEAEVEEENEENCTHGNCYDHLISCRGKLKITNIVDLIKKRVSFFGMYDIHD